VGLPNQAIPTASGVRPRFINKIPKQKEGPCQTAIQKQLGLKLGTAKQRQSIFSFIDSRREKTFTKISWHAWTSVVQTDDG